MLLKRFGNINEYKLERIEETLDETIKQTCGKLTTRAVLKDLVREENVKLLISYKISVLYLVTDLHEWEQSEPTIKLEGDDSIKFDIIDEDHSSNLPLVDSESYTNSKLKILKCFHEVRKVKGSKLLIAIINDNDVSLYEKTNFFDEKSEQVTDFEFNGQGTNYLIASSLKNGNIFLSTLETFFQDTQEYEDLPNFKLFLNKHKSSKTFPHTTVIEANRNEIKQIQDDYGNLKKKFREKKIYADKDNNAKDCNLEGKYLEYKEEYLLDRTKCINYTLAEYQLVMLGKVLSKTDKNQIELKDHIKCAIEPLKDVFYPFNSNNKNNELNKLLVDEVYSLEKEDGIVSPFNLHYYFHPSKIQVSHTNYFNIHELLKFTYKREENNPYYDYFSDIDNNNDNANLNFLKVIFNNVKNYVSEQKQNMKNKCQFYTYTYIIDFGENAKKSDYKINFFNDKIELTRLPSDNGFISFNNKVIVEALLIRADRKGKPYDDCILSLKDARNEWIVSNGYKKIINFSEPDIADLQIFISDRPSSKEEKSDKMERTFESGGNQQDSTNNANEEKENEKNIELEQNYILSFEFWSKVEFKEIKKLKIFETSSDMKREAEKLKRSTIKKKQ